jgi:geranylgeranyl diphosphate synthase type I
MHLMLPKVEEELQRAIEVVRRFGDVHRCDFDELHAMLAYHMGWLGEGAGPEARGKRIRPFLVLLTTTAAGGEWVQALPAASAVELIHNFSLIHDDIEDNSPLRRGRPTVWTKWGIPQAINAGDALFTLAHLEILRLAISSPQTNTLRPVYILQQTCLKLTQGQYLDISYEPRMDLPLDAYWPMISGKTAALLAACTEIGALCARVSNVQVNAYRQFGENLGMAFQAHDDYLGIWGDANLTGKSTDSDLVTGKKTLPVLFGLNQHGQFFKRWMQGPIHSQEAQQVAALLAEEGAKEYTQQIADRMTLQALTALDQANPQGEGRQALLELSNLLLLRSN